MTYLGRYPDEPATDDQLTYLADLGITARAIRDLTAAGLTRLQASTLIDAARRGQIREGGGHRMQMASIRTILDTTTKE